MRISYFGLAFSVLGAALLLFFAVPIVTMVAKQPAKSLLTTFAEPEVRSALWVSVSAAAMATGIALVLGVPLAYVLARRDFPGKVVIDALVDMPIAVPHTVAGIALLTVLAPGGMLGGPAARLGINFVDALPGTVAAMLFVSAPFVVNAARSGFEAVSPRYEKVSRSLGASSLRTFFSITLPMARGSILSGAVMSWARAVSEFGAVLIIAYFPRVGPTLMYERFTSFGLSAARPVAVLLLIVSLGVFAALRLTGGRRKGGTAAGA